MANKFSSLLVCCFLSFLCFAQFDYKAQFIAKEIKPAKTIYIINYDVDVNLAKASGLVEDAVKKYWTATKPEFKTVKFSEIKDKKSDDIYIGLIKTINYGLYEDKGPEPQVVYAVAFLSCDKSNKPQLHTSHPRIYLTRQFDELDIISAVRILNTYADATLTGKYDNNLRVATSMTPTLYRLAELNPGKLKAKTLLLDRAALDKKVDEATIKEIYTGKFKLVTRAEILQAVKDQDPQYAYYVSEAFRDDNISGVLTAPVVLDAQSGNMLSYSKITGGVMTNQFNPAPAPVTKGFLKEIAKNAE
ncbi:MAG TPA: hypothetical protein VK154_04220 [Chitinophagales bacterium]|nr:hypothetical protein [Chitinophagales bacterium]